MKFLKNLILYSVGCIICGKPTKAAICSQCIKKFVFSIPQDLINREFIFYKDKPSQNLIDNTYFLSPYKYTYVSKTLFNSIKRRNNRVGLWAIKEIFDYYINLDPFNLFKNLTAVFENNLLFVFVIPSNPKSKYLRNLNITNYIARFFITYLIQKYNTKVIKCSNIVNLNKNAKLQKKLNKLQRLTQAKDKIQINKTLCITCIKGYTSAITSYNISVLIIDDVTTTGATLFYAKQKINNCLKHIFKQNIKFILFTMFNVDIKKQTA